MKLNKQQEQKIIPIKFIDDWMLKQFKPGVGPTIHSRLIDHTHMELRKKFKQFLFDTKKNPEIIFDISEISQADIDDEKYALAARFMNSLKRLHKNGFIEKDISARDVYHPSDKHLYIDLLRESLLILDGDLRGNTLNAYAFSNKVRELLSRTK